MGSICSFFEFQDSSVRVEQQAERHVCFYNFFFLPNLTVIIFVRLMNTWLAYASNRAYVFHDFAWVESHYPWPISSYHEGAPRTPLNALISGPSAGGPWEEGDPAPRAVSEAYFETVCPKQERKVINTRDIKPSLRDADGIVIFQRWKALLTETKERCLEITAAPREEDPFPETFDISYWSTARSLPLWDAFVSSPVSRLLGTSTIVESAIRDNMGLFLLPSSQSSSRNNQSYVDLKVKNPLSSVFSIHVRRGDFKQACLEHAAVNSTFYNWNLLPFLPDKLNAHSRRKQNKQHILERCWPTAEYIRARVKQAKRSYEDQTVGHDLSVLYIMSNDRTDWIEDLKDAFTQDGWRRVVMSRDLKLNPQQRDVSVAVDMEIGRSSAVFIGNGVCKIAIWSQCSFAHFLGCSGRRLRATWCIED